MENQEQISRGSSIATALNDLPADVWRRISERLGAIRRSDSRSSTATAVEADHEVSEGLLVNFEAEADEQETEADEQKTEADEQETEADEQEAEADEQETEAEEQETEADEQETEADEQEAEADEQETEADEQETEADEQETEAASQHQASRSGDSRSSVADGDEDENEDEEKEEETEMHSRRPSSGSRSCSRSSSSLSSFECVEPDAFESISDEDDGTEAPPLPRSGKEMTWDQLDEEQAAVLDSYWNLLEERRQIIETRERDLDAEMRDFLEQVGVEFDDVLKTLAKLGRSVSGCIDALPSVEWLMTIEVENLERNDWPLSVSRKRLEAAVDGKEGEQEFGRGVADKERKSTDQCWREQLAKYRRLLAAYLRAFNAADSAANKELDRKIETSKRECLLRQSQKESEQLSATLQREIDELKAELVASAKYKRIFADIKRDCELAHKLKYKALTERDEMERRVAEGLSACATAHKMQQEAEGERDELKKRVSEAVNECELAREARKNAEIDRDEIRRVLAQAQADCAKESEARKETEEERDELKRRVEEVLFERATALSALQEEQIKRVIQEQSYMVHFEQHNERIFRETAVSVNTIRVNHANEMQRLKAELENARMDAYKRVTDALSECASAHKARRKAEEECDELRRRVADLSQQRKGDDEDDDEEEEKIHLAINEKKHLVGELASAGAERTAAKPAKGTEAQNGVEKATSKFREGSCWSAGRHSCANVCHARAAKKLQRQLTDALAHRVAEKNRWEESEAELKKQLDACRAECSALKTELDEARTALASVTDAHNHAVAVKCRKCGKLMRRVEALIEELASERAKRHVRERKYIDALTEMTAAAERLNIVSSVGAADNAAAAVNNTAATAAADDDKDGKEAVVASTSNTDYYDLD